VAFDKILEDKSSGISTPSAVLGGGKDVSILVNSSSSFLNSFPI